MKYKIEKMTVEEFTQLKKDKKIKLDRSFQVGTDEASRWDTKQQSKYIKSILLGSAPSPFILVDVDAALNYQEENGTDDESIEYFRQAQKDGYKYISVDGNNRSISILNFYNNKIKVPTYEYECDNRPVDVKSPKDKFNTLNIKLKHKYLETELSFAIYTEIAKKDCPVLFRNVNDGKPLNGQQIRQSYPSLLADYVRDKRDHFETSLKQFVQNKDFIVLKADEWIARCISYATYEESSKKHLDKVYKQSFSASKVVKPGKSDSDFNRVLNSVLTMIKPGLGNLKKSSNAVFDLFVICYDFKMNNIKIDKPKEFYDLWLKTTGSMFADEDTFYDYEKKSGHPTSEIFKDIVKHPYENAQKQRRKLVLDEIQQIALEKRILIQQENPDDYFNYNEKAIMWKRQNGICPLTDKEIPFAEIADWTKWQGDAIDPKDNGGIHNLSNGQLVCAKANNEKSNKILTA